MKRISINDKDAIQLAAEVVINGGVIVYPTDTLYGFGADATNKLAVDRINTIKGRTGPISVIADSVERVASWSTLEDREFESIKKYIGGAQTIIIPVHDKVTVPSIQGEGGSLGVRIPSHAFGPKLAAQTGRPITTTSVNRTGMDALNTPDEIFNEFNNEVDLLIDDGILPESSGSAIFLYHKDGIKQLR